MKSFCIKTNNKNMIDYLLKKIDTIELDNIHFSNNKFKLYENVIIHYKGNNISEFYNKTCEVLTDTILYFYENQKIKEIINSNYFYFLDIEKKEIINSCIDYLGEDNHESSIRKEYIYISLLKYINENDFFILDGFVDFRLSEYFKTLDYVIDICVNSFLIEKEYYEFITLLKLYINSQKCNTNLIHLIYMDGESTLIDSNKNIVCISDNIMNAKYLSDITFSSNDYSLNTLLNILPKKIIIHQIDDEDEFIKTLKLIFEDRISICTNCSICNIYKKIHNNI